MKIMKIMKALEVLETPENRKRLKHERSADNGIIKEVWMHEKEVYP